MITTNTDKLKMIERLLKSDGIIRISTFNLTLDKNSTIYQLLINNPNLKLLVGSFYRMCHSNCGQCKVSAQWRSDLLKSYKDDGIKFKLTSEHHFKLYASEKEIYVGGMNFTNSNWTDMLIKINDKSVIKYFDEIYLTAKDNQFYILPEPIIQFGKYKGEPLSKIKKEDKGYLDWIKTQMDIDTLKKYQLYGEI